MSYSVLNISEVFLAFHKGNFLPASIGTNLNQNALSFCRDFSPLSVIHVKIQWKGSFLSCSLHFASLSLNSLNLPLKYASDSD